MTDKLVTMAIGTRRTAAEVVEYWNERAAHRQYDAGYPREEAERLAVEDVEIWLKEKS